MVGQTSNSQAKSDKPIRVTVWRGITGFSIAIMVLLAILLAWATKPANVTSAVVPLPSQTPTVTPTPTLTPTPTTIPVTYQLVTENEAGSTLSIDVWFSSGQEDRTQEQISLSAGQVQETTVQAPMGAFVEVFAAMRDTQTGVLTCRIIVAGKTIQETTSQGQGAGVYCSGLATP
ncbi:MAG: hypothetical protein K1X50_18625 [Candidatus Promineofilum sp.]|jgi:hypothetical protein|nr:hypothetical protein [Promineifilum sp.]